MKIILSIMFVCAFTSVIAQTNTVVDDKGNKIAIAVTDTQFLRRDINANSALITTNTNNIALKVNIADTASMLLPYAKTTAVALKVNISDTATMLNPYSRNTTARAFSKVGNTQATNADAVLNADAIYHSGNVNIGGTTNPTRSLVLTQKTTSDGFQFTGVPLNGPSTGTGIIQTMFYNISGNKQMGIMDADGVGNSAYGCIRIAGSSVMGIDCANATNNTYFPLNLGAPTGSRVMLGGDNTNTQPAATAWTNGSMSIGAGIKTTSTTNGLIVQGNSGFGFASPVTKLHVFGNGLAYPATSGTAQSAGHVVRLQGSNNALLDIGGFSTLGFWLQSSDASNLAVNYPLLINPNGGNVGIGTTAPNANALLDISSTTKGILIPRMTTVQRDAIATPVQALGVFNTTTATPQYHNGTSWRTTGAPIGFATLSLTTTTAITNVVTAAPINTNDEISGAITHDVVTNNSRISITESGILQLSYLPQIERISNTAVDAIVWVRKNGTTPIVNSAVRLLLITNSQNDVIPIFFTTAVVAGDYFELMSTTATNGAYNFANTVGSGAGATAIPQTPAIIVTATLFNR